MLASQPKGDIAIEAWKDAMHDMLQKVNKMRRKHRLAYEHYSALDTLWITFPLGLITLASGILAFFIDNQSPRQAISLAIGVLALVSTAMQKAQSSNNWGPRAAMHLQVTLSLANLQDKMDLDLKTIEGLTSGIPIETKEKSETINNLKIYRGVYDQALESCTSALPIRVTVAFRLLQDRLTLAYETKYPNNFPKEAERLKRAHFKTAYTWLYYIIDNAPLFPYLRVMDPEGAVTIAIEKTNQGLAKKTGAEVDQNVNAIVLPDHEDIELAIGGNEK
jgi:hypothetical protein